MSKPFWEALPLHALNPEQWEALCDRCGLCCLTKLEDEDSGEVVYTSVACRLLDLEGCGCRHYRQRRALVPDCIALGPQTEIPDWLPDSCAYKRLAGGLNLLPWHPLVSGTAQSVRAAGYSACAFAIPEQELPVDADIEDYVLEWPG